MKAYEETIRKYYKYQYRTFTQPTLISNNYLGGESFAVSAEYEYNNTYWAYHGLDNTGWLGAQANNWYIFYNPNPLKVTKLTFSQISNNYIQKYDLYGSNDNSTWTKIESYNQGSGTVSNDISNEIYYNYYKIQTTSIYTRAAFCNLIITADEKYPVVSTSSDYDFYKDVKEYKIVSDVTEHDVSTKTFRARASLQEWTVPSGITELHVDCVASKGYRDNAGKGGRVQCDLTVTPNQTLYFVVGEIPTVDKPASYNASDIRTDNTGITDTTSLNSRILVAGGGGGGSSNYGGYDGGGEQALPLSHISLDNDLVSPTGGTQETGGLDGGDNGSHGNRGQRGSFGLGGNSGNNGAGSGGAGWYGGGGGGNHRGNNCGGGGGSSYTDTTLCSNVVHTQGYNDDEGYITITANGSWKEYTTDYKAFNIK